MDTKTKEYSERYYTKKAIEYLKEKGVDLTAQAIKRASNYFKAKNNMKKYQQYIAKTIDSSFMKFINDYESEVYCNASFQQREIFK